MFIVTGKQFSGFFSIRLGMSAPKDDVWGDESYICSFISPHHPRSQDDSILLDRFLNIPPVGEQASPLPSSKDGV